MINFYHACKTHILISYPQILTGLLSASIGVISMYLLSLLGHDALAAGALISSTYSFLIMIAFTSLYSISFLISQKLSQGKKNEVVEIVHSGFILATFLSIPLIIIIRNIYPILIFLKQPNITSKITAEYFEALSYGILASLYGMVISQFLTGILRPQITVIFSTVAVIISTILGYLLLFGKFGLPCLGIIGIAYSIAIASWLSLILFAMYVYLNSEIASYKIFTGKVIISLSTILSLFNKGWPISVQYATEILALTMITYIIGTLGQQALAAQQITLQASILSVMITAGMSQATSVLVGKSYGMRDYNLGRLYYHASILMATIFNGITAILFIFFPNAIISIFLDIQNPINTYTIELTKTLLLIVAITRIADGIRNIATSALRGLNDTYLPMFTAIVSCWIIAMPISFFLKSYYGAAGIRCGLSIGIIFGAYYLARRFYKLALVNDVKCFNASN